MIHTLSIQNYALITSLHIDLHRGFSVITGETGAGKSILLGAINLLLGQRAETRMIKAGASRCVIEAEFDLSGYGLDAFFKDNDFDFDGHTCLLRRELTASGKSRAFINDTPAQVAQLRELGDKLIDIHSQHQNLLLATEDFQLSVLDILGHTDGPRKAYAEAFAAYQRASRDIRDAEQALRNIRDEEDYLRFQLQQLDELHLEAGRQDTLEQEAQMLEHAEDIREALFAADALMQGDGTNSAGVISALREAQHHLAAIADVLPEADALAARVDSCLIELRDVQSEIEDQAEHIDSDPQRLEAVNEWLSKLYSAMKKHHVPDENGLIALADEFRRKLDAITYSDENMQQLKEARQKAYEETLRQAQVLTELRKKAAQQVERQMRELLTPLGIPNIRFSVEVRQHQEPTATGIDQVDFLFSANKNSPLQRIADVASGGEIARVMLSLKAMLSGAVQLPTIIFDEIDTGVSGQIAERMARIMQQMADGGRQVISITHLPQIAAIGEHHYRVFKQDDADGTSTHIEELDEQQRVNELAHMLSGSELTEAAVDNARALLRKR